MFGRVRRQSMRSLEELEMEERYSSKIIKHDSLSIYEATLMKLREGSRRDVSQVQEDPTRTDVSSSSIASDSAERETIAADTGCSSAGASSNSRGDQCIDFLKEQKDRNVSVLYLFSKYKSSQQALSSPDPEAMMIENESSSASSSPCSDNYQLIGSSMQHLQEAFFSSPVV